MKSKKSNLIAVCLMIIIVLSLMLSGCNSIEYRSNIKRYIGEYSTFDFYIMVRINDYSPDGMEGEFDQMVYGINENGYYYMSSTNEITFREIALDKNLVKAINDTIDLIGEKATLNKEEVSFENSNVLYKYLGYSYDDSYTNGLNIKINLKDNLHPKELIVIAYYDDPTKKIKIGFADETESVDGTLYTYNITIFMEKI